MCKTRWGREKTHTQKHVLLPLYTLSPRKRGQLLKPVCRCPAYGPASTSHCRAAPSARRGSVYNLMCISLARSLASFSSFSSPTARLLRSNACTKITMTAPALFTDKLPSQARVRQQRDWPTNWHGPLCLCLSVRLATPSTTRVFTHHATPAFTFDPVTNGPRLDGK